MLSLVKKENMKSAIRLIIKTYCPLAKPGIILGNAITAAGGFALASKGQFDFLLFLATLVGISLIIACSCVCNNYIDREMDAKMNRTKKRAFVKGEIDPKKALFSAGLLGLLGVAVLALYANYLTAGIGALGFLLYVAVYSPIKYRTHHATLIGSIAGAIPPVVGYTAVSNHLDLGAILVFGLIVMWQMPHFFAIAIYRLKDYTNASIPILPITKGLKRTKIQMVFYTLGFILVGSLPTVFGLANGVLLAVAGMLGIAWLGICLKGFKTDNNVKWAREVFLFSLWVVMGVCLAIPFSF